MVYLIKIAIEAERLHYNILTFKHVQSISYLGQYIHNFLFFFFIIKFQLLPSLFFLILCKHFLPKAFFWEKWVEAHCSRKSDCLSFRLLEHLYLFSMVKRILGSRILNWIFHVCIHNLDTSCDFDISDNLFLLCIYLKKM